VSNNKEEMSYKQNVVPLNHQPHAGLLEEACGIKSYNAVKFCKLCANMKRKDLQGYKFLKQHCRYDLILN
jgi:hypothetical protein